MQQGPVIGHRSEGSWEVIHRHSPISRFFRDHNRFFLIWLGGCSGALSGAMLALLVRVVVAWVLFDQAEAYDRHE